MRLYQRQKNRPKQTKNEKQTEGLFHILAPSVFAIFACMVCLCGISWAWFSVSVSTATATITTPSYTLNCKINEETEIALQNEGNSYTVQAAQNTDSAVQSDRAQINTCVITLTASGTSGATGYCKVVIGEEIYYTEQIIVGNSLTFTAHVPAETKIEFYPRWGNCFDDGRTEANTITSEFVYGTAPEQAAVSAENDGSEDLIIIDPNAVSVPQPGGIIPEQEQPIETDGTDENTVPSEEPTETVSNYYENQDGLILIPTEPAPETGGDGNNGEEITE